MRTLEAVKNQIAFAFRSPKYFIELSASILIKKYPPALEINKISKYELLERIKHGSSLIRIGDGEAMLMTGRSIHFQPFHPKILSTLNELIFDYKNDSPYILAIPFFAIEESESTLDRRGRKRIWRLFRILFQYFPKNASFFDAVAFYHKGSFEGVINSIPINNQIVIVTSVKNMTHQLDTYFKNHKRAYTYLETLKVNAFSDYKKIKEEVIRISKIQPLTLLTACGPAGKILSYELSKEYGIQCIDVGHGIEILGQDGDYSKRL